MHGQLAIPRAKFVKIESQLKWSAANILVALGSTENVHLRPDRLPPSLKGLGLRQEVFMEAHAQSQAWAPTQDQPPTWHLQGNH